jgi:hypothetical protein
VWNKKWVQRGVSRVAEDEADQARWARQLRGLGPRVARLVYKRVRRRQRDAAVGRGAAGLRHARQVGLHAHARHRARRRLLTR